MSGGLRLIVNADDFGIAEAVNRGIVEAHDRGIVTSTSLMAGGTAFAHAVELARSRPRLDIGVHLTLTELEPLVVGPGAATLLGADGRFLPHVTQLAARAVRGGLDADAVRAELEAQIRRVLDAGLAVSHLDGHQHAHVLPGVAPVVAELAARFGIAAVRHPAERVRGYMLRRWRGARRLAEQVALACVAAASPLRHLKHADEFAGFFFGGQLDESNLAVILASLPRRGTAEIMCHPGADDMRSAGGAWQYSWAAERAALVSPRIRALLEAQGTQLMSYREL
jgi:chitin disaccharide deacetylase